MFRERFRWFACQLALCLLSSCLLHPGSESRQRYVMWTNSHSWQQMTRIFFLLACLLIFWNVICQILTSHCDCKTVQSNKCQDSYTSLWWCHVTSLGHLKKHKNSNRWNRLWRHRNKMRYSRVLHLIFVINPHVYSSFLCQLSRILWLTNSSAVWTQHSTWYYQ